MPGSGKSTVGKELAKKLNYNFIDVDRLMEKKEGLPLQEILRKLGGKKFLELEEEIVLELTNLNNTIISPGGSIIYMEKAMNHLKENSKIIFLDVSLDIIKERLSTAVPRGIIGGSAEEVFAERNVLYKKYADFTIPADAGIDETTERLKFYILNNIPLDQ